MLLITVIACGLSIVHSFEAIMVSRFIIGILNAIHISVASGYVKETFPTSLRNPFGAIHSCGRVLGALVCFTIARIFDYREDDV
jgi:MFS family permease